MRYGWLALALVAGGCGSGAHGHGPDPDSDSEAISSTVVRSYRTTDANDCSRLYTASFVAAVYQDVAHCRSSVLDRKGAPQAVTVLSTTEHGPKAAVKVRIGSAPATVMLVRTGGRWQVDDVVDPKYGSVKAGIGRPAEPAAHKLGAVVRFGPVAGIAPRARFSAAVLQVLRAGDSVYVKVLLGNRGPKPFRGGFIGELETRDGQQLPSIVRGGGRRPDWTDDKSPAVAPGKSSVRWITFTLPASARPEYVDLIPSQRTKDGPVGATPMQARWLAG